GRPSDAANAYREALEQDFSMTEALSNLLGLSQHVDISNELVQAQALLKQSDLRAQALIGYGLGKAYEQKNNYTAAYEAYQSANLARREATGRFDREAFDARIQSMIDLFSATFFDKRRRFGDPTQRPVFIVGLPRSGTTLTEQIISSHPDCFGAGELNVLTDLATGSPDRLGSNAPAWPDCAPQLSQQQLKALGQDYIKQSGLRVPEEPLRVVDKQPLNFWHLGLIAIALPNARIIHCQRDIRDCGLSIFSHNFNTRQNWSTDLGDIAHYWCGYRRLMQHWQEVTGLRMLDLCYEDTVSNLKTSAENLLSFLELPWDKRVLNFHENDRAVQTPSRWQVRQPVYKSSVARWQHYGDKLEPLINAAKNFA
ncbi:MAG: sulfotransferase, partial [Arenicella sp.]|nr:sulfotransferase [Arenicella sp.]